MTYRIEKGYTPADVPQLLQINRLCFEGVERPPDNMFKDALEVCDVWVLRKDVAVGFCIVNPSGPYLWSVAVSPGHRHEGWGESLINAALKHYAGQGSMTLHCAVHNPVQKLYFDLGFRVHKVIKNHYVTYDGLLMKRML